LAKESLERVANALQDELGRPKIELFYGSYSTKTDQEVETGIMQEKSSYDVKNHL
jgi:hypothetical protein